jgi:hypothetical protein
MNMDRNSRSLPEDVRDRLVRLAGKPMTREGELVIEAPRLSLQICLAYAGSFRDGFFSSNWQANS